MAPQYRSLRPFWQLYLKTPTRYHNFSVFNKKNNKVWGNIDGRALSTHINDGPSKFGLYSSALERDSCGVGMIAQLKKIPTRAIVVQANEMLARMSHRGGCGCEPNSGDGAGMLVGMPHDFFDKTMLQTANIKLPKLGDYGAGNVFFSKDPENISKCKEIFGSVAERCGMAVIGWRVVPTNGSDLGYTSLASEPHIEQVFVNTPIGISNEDFERELFRLRRLVTSEIEEKLLKDFYICSLSSRTITYKGQLTPSQLYNYFIDLQDNRFHSYVALVHSRFSTNTFPSWDRAQPLRIMCHNGEINTLRGNKNWMFSRGSNLASEYFGDQTTDLLPICSENMSDSGNFDSVLELITKAGKTSLPEAMMMMIPEAWQNNPSMEIERKAMYRYYSCLMEPWDGPAMMAFTDGNVFGATLDRNGLRPSRYYVTHDDHVILSSEVGVLPELEESQIKEKCRLEPGKMFLVDFEKGEIVSDAQVKENVSRARPYQKWIKDNLVTLDDLVVHYKKVQDEQRFRQKGTASIHAELQRKERDRERLHNTNRRLNMFGYTSETMDLLLYPMGCNGKEPLGSMGNDAPLAVLSKEPKLPFEYFKQLFAQVTNPPIDPIREGIVMTLSCPVGPEGNILKPTEKHCERLEVPHPVLSLEEMLAIKHSEYRCWTSQTLDATFPSNLGSQGLVDALERLCEDATRAIAEDSHSLIVVSDRLAGADRYPVPSLLACGAIHQHLIRNQQRSRAAIFIECGDAKEVHDFCTLIGFGADGVCPYVAYQALEKMNSDGLITARNGGKLEANEKLFARYRDAAGKGILKVMSKMGISTLQSYKGAQVFEAVGLSDDIIDLCFTGTTSRIKGTNFDSLCSDIARFHAAAYPPHSTQVPLVINPGNYHYRDQSEEHFNSPQSIVALQVATKSKSRELFKEFSRISDEQCRKVTIRGILKFKSPLQRIPLSEVEPVENIFKRFNTGAMSLGSISREAHETLAVAMNSIGGRSNTGEGGEDPVRFSDNRRSAIKQVASGRFGVTSNYLANSDQIQIKMAQGAKPGEGGELPGHKVSDYIGELRHTTPGVGLISPPPHHDIYCIEDLAQLIHDLKNSNPIGEVSVKLVSEVGVGVIAAGVAKAKADHITISGHDGGTGAAAWTGVKYAGLPWELGLAETQQTLVLNDLRSRVRIQTDGQLKTARDVVIAALLGAEEFGFATAPLVTLGCIMMRKCHLNTCPVGIATQDEELRKKFLGKPEHVINYFWLMAEEIREYMAQLGFSSMDDMIGRSDMLCVDESALHYKSSGLDLSPILVNASTYNEDAVVRRQIQQNHGLELALDNEFIEKSAAALDRKEQVVLNYPITNVNRTVGTMLSYEISKRFGQEGLPDNTIQINLKGHGGQSLGFALAKGVLIQLEGDSNDFVGKALSGGKIAVFPSSDLSKDSNCFDPSRNVIVGNAVLYGATSGSIFLSGKAGERFAVRNSGAIAVVEGVGDHACEYMTGGRVIVLGDTGRNFGAGMSGGIAYVLNPKNDFSTKCNMEMVDLERITEHAESDQIRKYVEEHVILTGSPQGKSLLNDWENTVTQFVKVYPRDYKRVMEALKQSTSEECA